MNLLVLIIAAVVVAFILPNVIFRNDWKALPVVFGSLIVIVFVTMGVLALPWEGKELGRQETYRVTLLESPATGQYLEAEPDSNHNTRYVYHYLDEKTSRVKEGHVYWPTVQTGDCSLAEMVCYSVLTEYTILDGRFYYKERTTETVILLPRKEVMSP